MNRAYEITINEITNKKYLYTDMLLGIYGILLRNGCSHSAETVDGMKEAIEEYFFGGFEPEWATMKACDWWFGLDHTSFIINNESGYHRWASPPPDHLIENCGWS